MIQLNKDEHIIHIEHKHWFILTKEVAVLNLIVLVPLLIPLFYVGGLSQIIIIAGSAPALFFAFFALWLLALWIVFYVIWTDWYLDVVVLTNQRLMHGEQHGLFARDVATLQLHRIQDITTEVHGILPTLLRYGDLYVQTAGQEREFIVKDIAKPEHLRNAILQAAGEQNTKRNVIH